MRRDPDLAERLGREACSTFEREHDPERASRELRDWLAECARRTPPAPAATRATRRATAFAAGWARRS